MSSINQMRDSLYANASWRNSLQSICVPESVNSCRRFFAEVLNLKRDSQVFGDKCRYFFFPLSGEPLERQLGVLGVKGFNAFLPRNFLDHLPI